MADISLTTIDQLIVHFVGNKNNGDGVRFSDDLTEHADISSALVKLFKGCLNTNDYYQFYFHPSVELNPVYKFLTSIFDDKSDFVNQTKNLGRYLYDNSNHPNIKAGEFGIAYLTDCGLDDELVDCIALFKSEVKDSVLSVSNTLNGFSISAVEGMNTSKLDKGCLVFRTEKDSGYLVVICDNTNKSAGAQYWANDFLGLKLRNTDYQQTNQFLGITKQFVTKQLSEDQGISNSDKIEILNKSVEYFKTKEVFSKSEFEEEVFGDSKIIDSFRDFDVSYRSNNELDIADEFNISNTAVKKQAKSFKRVLKLDQNFDVYIKGDKNLLERGVEKDGRKYYKLYYDIEN